MATRELNDLDDATSILGFVRDRRQILRRAEAEQLQAAVAWAAMNATESDDRAATLPGAKGRSRSLDPVRR